MRILKMSWLVVMVALGGICPLAPAQSTTQPEGESVEESSANPRGLLAGPKVPETALRMELEAFGVRRGAGSRTMPIRKWMEALNTLALTIEQKSQTNGIVDEFRKLSREFQASHGEELKLLRRSVNQDRKSDRQPDAKQIRRIRELQSKSPVVKVYQVRIWNVLEDAQQENLRMELARIRATPPKPPSRNAAGSGQRPPADKRLDAKVKDKRSGQQ